MKSIKKYLKFAAILFAAAWVVRAGVAIGTVRTATPLTISQNGNFSDATGPSLSEGAFVPLGADFQPLSQSAFASQIQATASVGEAVDLFEELRATEFSQYFRKRIAGKPPSLEEISETLFALALATKNNAALIYADALSDELRELYIFPARDYPTSSKMASSRIASDSFGQLGIPAGDREAVKKSVTAWREEIALPPVSSEPRSLAESQKLYQWLLKRLEPSLQANQTNTLVFSMGAGLRSLPIAALHDGKQYLIEKYSVALIPSFGLTDTRYVDVRNQRILYQVG